MARLPKLDHVKYVKRGTKVYPYFNTGQKKAGKVVYAPLPQPSAPEFFTVYAALKAGRTKRATVEYTVAMMADDFMASKAFAENSKATRELYGIQIRKIIKALGKIPVKNLTAKHVRKVLEAEAWGAATQNSVVATLGALYFWGRREEKTTLNPIQDIEARKMGEHEPWPEHVLEAALVAQDDTVRLAVHLLYFTGQRIGDVCDMTWDSVAGGTINITQEKTDKPITFGLSKELLAELERTPRRGKTLLTGVKGGRKNDDMLRRELGAFVATFGFKRVPHGLRKNAVNALLEAGCTYHQVGAVTGQSLATIEHYAKRVNRHKLGSDAMAMLDRARVAMPGTESEQETLGETQI